VQASVKNQLGIIFQMLRFSEYDKFSKKRAISKRFLVSRAGTPLSSVSAGLYYVDIRKIRY
jgi:hypothetical protein